MRIVAGPDTFYFIEQISILVLFLIVLKIFNLFIPTPRAYGVGFLLILRVCSLCLLFGNFSQQCFILHLYVKISMAVNVIHWLIALLVGWEICISF